MFMNREENLFTNKSYEKYMYNYKYLFLNQIVKPFKLYTFSILKNKQKLKSLYMWTKFLQNQLYLNESNFFLCIK